MPKSIRVDDELYDKLKRQAEESRLPIGKVLNSLVAVSGVTREPTAPRRPVVLRLDNLCDNCWALLGLLGYSALGGRDSVKVEEDAIAGNPEGEPKSTSEPAEANPDKSGKVEDSGEIACYTLDGRPVYGHLVD